MSELEKRLEKIVLQALEGSSEGTQETLEKIDERLVLIEERLRKVEVAMTPLTEAYNGIIFGRKVIVGLASLTLGIASLGGIMITVLNHFRR